MVRSEIPNVFYYYIHSKLWELSKGYDIREKDVKGHLAQWRIPKNIKPLIIKELILLGLMKKNGRNIIRIQRPNFDESKIDKFYRELKIY